MTAQLDQVNTQLPSQPPPSIIVSRSEALRYVESCELAEMMPSGNNNNFLNQLLSSSSGSSNANNTDGGGNSESSVSGGNKYASIIQMAFLLYLGEYVHARHLWRRHRSNNTSNTSDDESNQLSMFWTAAKYCYLWSTGGISSSLNSTDDDESSNLPYSTLMLRSLHSNAESSLEPLATYSKELVSIFRYRVNDRLRSSFDDIREDEFMLRMNLSSDDIGGDDVLGRYGWQRTVGDATHLVPNQEWKSPTDIGGGEHSAMSTDGDRIHQLSEVVMFLEQTKMNA
mmetsp:Transcript_34661/g.51018  ORF Transcript_34661/g.51018 Transcript_34661/m.51018 type:complete len:284 (-) Transcript_34661:97-948(-)